jgi:hypothetical protein
VKHLGVLVGSGFRFSPLSAPKPTPWGDKLTAYVELSSFFIVLCSPAEVQSARLKCSTSGTLVGAETACQQVLDDIIRITRACKARYTIFRTWVGWAAKDSTSSLGTWVHFLSWFSKITLERTWLFCVRSFLRKSELLSIFYSNGHIKNRDERSCFM